MSYLLSIETSCDETSLALLTKEPSRDHNFLEYLNSHRVVSSVIASQAKYFAQYGGVIPEISARHHAEQIFELFDLILTEAAAKESIPTTQILSLISDIYVTTEPGLVSALRVGQEFAKVIKHHINTQGGQARLHPINHLHGHIISSFFGTEERWGDTDMFPHLHLLVSGGNTQLLLMTSPTEMQIVGQTLDDAAGECLDKIGRMVGLTYPAGATIGKIVGDRTDNPINLSLGMKNSPGFNFSYSGLKTAVRYYIRDHAESGIVYEQRLDQLEVDQLITGIELTPKLLAVRDILISVQTVVIEQLVRQTKKALREYRPKSLGLSGGVSASSELRKQVERLHDNFFLAPMALTGDNAVMIALAGVAAKYSQI
jgi:N6-L-threonylcarbamoyladenine synthase